MGTRFVRFQSQISYPDHLNTPRLIANQQGTTVWKWDQQEPFGNDVPNSNPSGAGAFDFPLRFPGQYFDRETNLAHNYYRDYDPSVGRYVQSDPIGLGGGMATYGYAKQNPLRFVDPKGLKPYVFRLTIGGGVSRFPYPIMVQVYNLRVTDALTGEVCNYTVACGGIGLGLDASISGGTHPVTWDDGKECSNCHQFGGTGLAGSFAAQIAHIGWTWANWWDVPNGPRLDFSGWSFGEISIGGVSCPSVQRTSAWCAKPIF